MTLSFQKAVKRQERLRLALDGPAGAGKTWTSLTIASALVERDGGRIAVIDSERGSARKYASDFDFDHLELPDNSPHTYIAAIRAAVEDAYRVLIIDSLSHAWEGTLELKDEVAKRSRSGDSFGAWREVTPVHNQLVDSMLRADAHLIVTMRTKTEYVVERDDTTGKNKIIKLGLRPVQREGVEYEFDVVGDLDLENTLIVSKSRCSELAGQVIRKPGSPLADTLWKWLNDGEPTASPADVQHITEGLNALPDSVRRAAKERFAAKFGRPDGLLAAQVAEAKGFVAAETAQASVPMAEGGDEGEPPDEPEQREPTGSVVSPTAQGEEFPPPEPEGPPIQPELVREAVDEARAALRKGRK